MRGYLPEAHIHTEVHLCGVRSVSEASCSRRENVLPPFDACLTDRERPTLACRLEWCRSRV